MFWLTSLNQRRNKLEARYAGLLRHARLNLRPGLRKALANACWLCGDRFVRIAVALLVGVWLARYLGPTQYGMYSYAVAFVGLFVPLATLGMDNIIVRDIISHPGEKYQVIGTAFRLRLSGSLLSVLAALTVVRLLRMPGDPQRAIVVIVALGTLFLSFDTIDLWFQSQVLSKYTMLAKGTAFSFATGMRVLFLSYDASLAAFAYLVVLESVLNAGCLLLAYHLNGQHVACWRFSPRSARETLRVSWPLIISASAIMVYMRIDQIMLGQMVGSRAVGVYSAAARISEVWYFIATALVSSLFPAILQSRRTSDREYWARLKKLFSLMAGLGLGVALVVSLFASHLVALIYGETYREAATILAVHVWATPFVFLGVAQMPWDAAESYTRLAMVRTLIGASVNVTLNLLLMPVYGGVGAALATVLSNACSAFLGNIVSRKTRGVFWAQCNALLLFPVLKMRANP